MIEFLEQRDMLSCDRQRLGKTPNWSVNTWIVISLFDYLSIVEFDPYEKYFWLHLYLCVKCQWSWSNWNGPWNVSS
jgi:hypothetical protein